MLMNDRGEYVCRVCGLDQQEKPWGEDGKTPSFVICYCCGCEAGYQDCQLSATKHAREKWLEKGSSWWDSKFKPENWSLEEQLSQIPSEYQ
jgi:hypothetical protein